MLKNYGCFNKVIIVSNNNLTFKQKIKLYKSLKDFFQNADLKNHPMEDKDIENLIKKLKMWGKDLRIRQLYYDI